MTAKEFLHFMISSLVEKSDAIEIEEKTDDLGLLLSLKVDASDIGSVIGKGGKTIDSIRTVLRVFGSRTGTRVNLRIIEEKPII